MRLNPKIKNFLLILLLIALSAGVYLNSLRGEFLIDDTSAILNNPVIHDTKAYFAKHLSLRSGVLWDTAEALLWYFGGADTFYYHLFAVLINALCVVLLFLLCNALFGNPALSFLSSLIFALHPIHTEAVSWISGGNYVFTSIFFLASLIFYVQPKKPYLNFFLALLFFAVSLLAGNAVVSLPFLFMIYDLFLRGKEEKAGQAQKFRLFAVSLLLLISLVLIASLFISRNKFAHTIFSFRGFSYLIVAVKAFVYYLKIIYLPLARGLYHPFAYNNTGINKISPAFFGSILIVFLSMLLFFALRKKHKPLSFGIAFFLITYLPYSNLIPVCNIVSERYMYLPTAGIAIILAYLFILAWEIINRKAGALKGFLRIIAMTSIVLFILSYGILTVKRNREYKDIITYWETNINNFPDGYMAYNNLAGTFYCMGEIEQAKAYSWVTLMINSQQPHVWSNLGKVYREQGDLKMAKYCYEQALKVDKQFLPALTALAQVEKEISKKKPILK